MWHAIKKVICGKEKKRTFKSDVEVELEIGKTVLLQLSQWIRACRQFIPVQSVIGIDVTHCTIKNELSN